MKLRAASLLLFVASASGGLMGCETRTLQSLVRPSSEGLVAHWGCDEASGDVLHDTSGNGHDGNITGATFTTGRFGNALSLERGQYVTVPAFPPASNNWTVALWMQIRSPLSDSGDASLLTTDLASAGGWAMIINDVRLDVDFRYWDGTPAAGDGYESYACSRGCLAADRWIHLVYVVDGDAKTLTLYTDGALRDPIPIQGSIKPGSADLQIGCGTSESLTYAGLLDDIAIYSRVLSQSEVQLLRNAAVPDLAARP